ncbi:MAG TPA: hypothetical protein VGB82_02135 [Alphaproteobacteria bacterium]
MTLSELFLRGKLGSAFLVLCDVRQQALAGVIRLTIPQRAVIRHTGQEYVFVLGPDQTIELRFVRTGVAARSFVTVLFGLTAGETVVYDPYRFAPSERARRHGPVVAPHTGRAG